MPRAAGQIDLRKNEAILNAAAEVLAERGMAAPIERIARVAGVSKQTIYNHYGSKQELVRALIARRAMRMTERLDVDGPVQDVEGPLADFAEKLLNLSLSPNAISLIRVIIGSGDDLAEAGGEIFEVGPMQALNRLARFLDAAQGTGKLAVPDPFEAAEFFIGMVQGQRQVRQLMAQPQRNGPDAIVPIAREAARRFVRAYAPVN